MKSSNNYPALTLRICNAIIRNIYVNNAGKLAAWLSASHVERG